MKKTHKYCCRYYHDGAWWGTYLEAYDLEDAEARAAKLGSLKVEGELIASIKIPRLFSPLIEWLLR